MEVSCPILFFCWLAQFTYFCKIDARISLLVHRKNIAFRFWFHWCKHLLSLTVKISTLLQKNTNCCYWNHEWNFPADLLFFCSMVWRHAEIPFHFNFQDQTPVFCASVLDSLAVELKGSKDFAKLYSGIAILGYIASLLETINARAFTHLLTLLGHRYPKVWDLAFDLYSVWTLFRWLATQWIEIYVVSSALRSGKLLPNKFTSSYYKMGILYLRTRWRKHWKLFLKPAGMETLRQPSFKN